MLLMAAATLKSPHPHSGHLYHYIKSFFSFFFDTAQGDRGPSRADTMAVDD